ncbi:hypothetical protein [Kordiimonas pumila]|uniref:Uncharacterized protein n=1 Tax=Kordiimonas pumila TaxID=2161677 RepID=A0ABV7D157_9PROT|nr:hypothetical protein [Kordiimonas pumila]
MSTTQTLAGIGACLFLWLFFWWREKRRQFGTVSLIPYYYLQFSLLIFILVLCAHLFALVTGIEWQPPFMR